MQPGSGAVDGAKGDFGLTEFLVENKCTEHRSLSLKADWLDKISKEARAEGKAAAVAIQFVDRSGNSQREDRWVMIREDEFSELLEAGNR